MEKLNETKEFIQDITQNMTTNEKNDFLDNLAHLLEIEKNKLKK